MKGIYKFECDYGRSGTLSGIFIATEELERIQNADDLPLEFMNILRILSL